MRQAFLTFPHFSLHVFTLQITGKSLANIGALSNTLTQIYKGSHGYVMWNDEIPNGGTSSSKAHAKGVMGYDANSGFFLRHSTPRFPPHRSSGYKGLPDNERIYGQTFLCTTVSLSELNRIAGQYLVMNAQIYDQHTPQFASPYRNITSFSAGTSTHNSAPQAIAFRTTGGTNFWDIAKSKSCSCSLWDHVAIHYRQNMDVLSWGRPLEPSACPPAAKYAVQNVLHINWGSIQYGETDEHSKWGVSKDHSTLCIGDINRMTSQLNRGGGATCFTNTATATAFAKLITSVAQC